MNKTALKQTTFYDILKKMASKKYNYPNKKMCSDGDIVNYLKSIKL